MDVPRVSNRVSNRRRVDGGKKIHFKFVNKAGIGYKLISIVSMMNHIPVSFLVHRWIIK